MNQFCPIAKASEVICEKWTLLIMREILMGGSRFNTIQRGLGSISPTVLTKRLKVLCDQGLVIRKKISGQKGFEYYPTACGQELMPILEHVGAWGMRWARQGMPDRDLDVELLMLYLERSIVRESLPGQENVIRFHFRDLQEAPNWWIVVHPDKVDTCIQDPGKDVDVYFTTDLRTMIELWMGDTSWRDAMRDDRIEVMGPAPLIRDVQAWMRGSVFQGIEPATAITN